MDERERMLAEGPRVAPEPQVADGTPPALDAPPSAQQTRAQPTRRPGRRGFRPWYARVIPFAIFLAVIGGRGLGRYGWVIVVAVVAIAAVARAVQRKSR